MARLEETLAGEIAEARLDSSGRFTLDLSKALEKLAGYQLPGSYTWACKLVQAAVASGCQWVTIRLYSQGCEFRLEGTLENVSWEDFESTLLDPRSTGNRAWDHLKQGLWSVLRESGRPFSVRLAGNGPGCGRVCSANLVRPGSKAPRKARLLFGTAKSARARCCQG